jgi:hypothetical protein
VCPQLSKLANDAFIKSYVFGPTRLGGRHWAPKVLLMFIAFLFSDPDVDVHFFKDLELI